MKFTMVATYMLSCMAPCVAPLAPLARGENVSHGFGVAKPQERSFVMRDDDYTAGTVESDNLSSCTVKNLNRTFKRITYRSISRQRGRTTRCGVLRLFQAAKSR